MDYSLQKSFMAVFAVSGSVVFLAMHAHKRLLSNFMKKMEFEIKNSTTDTVKVEPKKKVRFADNVVNHYPGKTRENFDSIPENYQVMYKGILKNNNFRR